MASNNIGTYKVKKLNHVTMIIKTTKQFAIRKFIAIKLIRLATLVLGCSIEHEYIENKDE